MQQWRFLKDKEDLAPAKFSLAERLKLEGEIFVGILPVLLFVLGVIFLFLGWRWQSPSNEEAMTAFKGFAHLKSEMLRVQNQVHVLEDKIHRVTQVERKGTECNEKCKLYSLHVTDQRERNGGVEIMPLGEERVNQSAANSVSQSNRKISSKYQEVLELAEEGEPIAKISQRLLLSQDAVMMILQMHQKGENQ